MKRVLGGILLAIGILIAAGSGLCTLNFLGSEGFRGPGGSSQPLGDKLILAIIVGGIPFAIGLSVFFIGRSLIRSAQNDPG